MRLFLSSAVLLTIVSSVFGETCPEIVKGKKKFLLYNEKVNWFQALFNCSSQGMSLATIESQEEQDMIEGQLHTYSLSGFYNLQSYYWLGGADLHKEGEFVWFSTNQEMKYRNFNLGEPDSGSNWMGVKQNCVKMVENLSPTTDYLTYWLDSDCGQSNRFVCEYYE